MFIKSSIWDASEPSLDFNSGILVVYQDDQRSLHQTHTVMTSTGSQLKIHLQKFFSESNQQSWEQDSLFALLNEGPLRDCRVLWSFVDRFG